MEEQEKIFIQDLKQQFQSHKESKAHTLRKTPFDKKQIHFIHKISQENIMFDQRKNQSKRTQIEKSPTLLLQKKGQTKSLLKNQSSIQMSNNFIQSKHQKSLQPICQNVELGEVTDFITANALSSKQSKGYNGKISNRINESSRKFLYESNNKHSQRLNLISSERYNQLQDDNLIQYLYVRKNKLLDSLLHKQNDHSKAIQLKNQQMMKKDLHKSNPQLRCQKQIANRTFQVKKQYNRAVNFNNFDLISCSQSLKMGQTKMLHIKKKKKQFITRNKGELWQEFQQKINKLQDNIYTKVPYLVQMGVHFKICK